MRYISGFLPTYTGLGGRRVKGRVGNRAVMPVQPRQQAVPALNQHTPHGHHYGPEQHRRREAQQEERRKVCRRINHRPVLFELRSGIDRRHHNLRGNDIVEHIDEEA